MKRIFFFCMVSFILAAGKINAQPAAGVYLFCNTITNGGSIALGHNNEVAINTKDEGVSTAIIANGGGLAAGVPSVADFVITKNFDVSSMRFRNRLLRRQDLPGNLEIRYYNGTSNNPVYVITLQNCLVSSIKDGNDDCTSGCPGIGETISFAAEIITWRNNLTATPQIITYNRVTNQVTSSGL